MELTEFKVILDEVGYPYTYYQFKKTVSNPVPSPPFFVYWTPFSSNFFADNKVYKKINNVQLELYTTKKDESVEEKLESVLDAHNISYELTGETFIESQQLFQRIYEMRLI